MSKAKDWVMIRVTRETHERLAALKRTLESDQGTVRYADLFEVDRFGIAWNSVIAVLLNRNDAHGERGRRAAARRRRGPRSAQDHDQKQDNGQDNDSRRQ